MLFLPSKSLMNIWETFGCQITWTTDVLGHRLKNVFEVFDSSSEGNLRKEKLLRSGRNRWAENPDRADHSFETSGLFIRLAGQGHLRQLGGLESHRRQDFVRRYQAGLWKKEKIIDFKLKKNLNQFVCFWIVTIPSSFVLQLYEHISLSFCSIKRILETIYPKTQNNFFYIMLAELKK